MSRTIHIGFLSVSGAEESSVREAVALASDRSHLDVSLSYLVDSDLQRHPERVSDAVRKIEDATVLVTVPRGGRDSLALWAKALEAAKGKLVIATEGLSHREAVNRLVSPDMRQRLTPEVWADFARYAAFGGVENYARMLLLVLQALGSWEGEVPPPQPRSLEGIYHPDAPEGLSREAYIDWWRSAHDREPRPIIGLWYYESFQSNGNLAFVDALIAEIEAHGALPLSVYHRRNPVEELGNGGAPWVVREVFMSDGAPVIDCLISTPSLSLNMSSEAMTGLLEELGVPVLQAIASTSELSHWRETMEGLTPLDISISVSQPEFDGAIITSLQSARCRSEGDLGNRQTPEPERTKAIVAQAVAWARLRRTSVSERRVAIIFHHYPPRNDRLGNALHLDSFESVKRLIDAMADRGYGVEPYESGEAISSKLLKCLTSDRRYLTNAQLDALAHERISPERAAEWRKSWPEGVRRQMQHSWGDAPGDLFTYNGQTLVGGMRNGACFIGLQPTRGRTEALEELTVEEAKLHDPLLPPPYQYLAFYRWLRDDFGAHAVIHVGKHGSLEWLPGKSVALSEGCYPELAIADLPHLYLYLVNDPGEGAQAKRRSHAVILDHNIPPQTLAETSPALESLAALLEPYSGMKHEAPQNLPRWAEGLWTEIQKLHLDVELGLVPPDSPAQVEDLVEALQAYLNDIAMAQINLGLHILGKPWEGEGLVDTLQVIGRFPDSEAGSLWETVAQALGEEWTWKHVGGKYLAQESETGYAEATKRIADEVRALLQAMAEGEWSPEAMGEVVASRNYAGPSEGVRRALASLMANVLPRTAGVTDEITHTLQGLDGGFVPPGPSGSPTRGRMEALPTGRNFFSLDPSSLPTRTAWTVGRSLGDRMIERYQQERGAFPEQVGMVLWASPTMRTGGETLAEALYLMGLKPVWREGSARVEGLEVIPAPELGRPRIDVTLRASGLFRDAFPNVLHLVDDAVRMIAALQEPDDVNFLARNVRREAGRLRESGMDAAEAERQATYRVFSSKPGAYGAGTNTLLDSKKWNTHGDLGEISLHWSQYAYGRNVAGVAAPEAFRQRMTSVQATIKNQDTREIDLFDGDDFNSYHGGMNAAVEHASGTAPLSITGDSSNPQAPVVRRTDEEIAFIFRTKLLNPKWIEGMKKHGFKAAGDLARRVEIAFQWDATTHVLDDWHYEQLADTYALDPAMREWFERHNPDALHTVAEQLLEAVQRGMWEQPGERARQLTELFLEMEGNAEDRIQPFQEETRK